MCSRSCVSRCPCCSWCAAASTWPSATAAKPSCSSGSWSSSWRSRSSRSERPSVRSRRSAISRAPVRSSSATDERVRVAGRELVRRRSRRARRGRSRSGRRRCSWRRAILPPTNRSSPESRCPFARASGTASSRSTRPGGEDLPFVYAGTLVTAGAGVARVHATGPRTGDRSHRHGDADARRAGDASASRGEAPRREARVARGAALRRRRGRLRRREARRARRHPRRPDVGDGDPAERVPGRRHDVPRARRVAPLASPGSGSPDPGRGVARRRHRALRRQDRDADGESHDGESASSRTERRSTSGASVPSRSPSRCTRRSSTAFSRAAKILSTRWSAPSRSSARVKLAGTEHLHDDWQLVREYPLTRERLAVVQVWRAPGRSRLVVAAKGAPEALALLCRTEPRRTQAEMEEGVGRARVRGPPRARGRASRTIDDASVVTDDPARLGPSLRRARRARRSRTRERARGGRGVP